MRNPAKIYARALVEATHDASRNAGEGMIQRFVVKLKDDGKSHLLQKIIFECETLLSQEQDSNAVEVSAAHPLSPEIVDELRKIFSRTTIKEQKDPSLLGGLRVKVGDRVYDGTMRRQLEKLRECFSV